MILDRLSDLSNVSALLATLHDLNSALMLSQADFNICILIPKLLYVVENANLVSEAVLLALRLLCLVLDSEPLGSNILIGEKGLPIIVGKMLAFKDFEVVEQCLNILYLMVSGKSTTAPRNQREEIVLSSHHQYLYNQSPVRLQSAIYKTILRTDGLSACTTFFDFFPLHMQLKAAEVLAELSSHVCDGSTEIKCKKDTEYVLQVLPSLHAMLYSTNSQILYFACVSIARMLRAYEKNFNKVKGKDECHASLSWQVAMIRQVVTDDVADKLLTLLHQAGPFTALDPSLLVRTLACFLKNAPDRTIPLADNGIFDVIERRLRDSSTGGAVSIETPAGIMRGRSDLSLPMPGYFSNSSSENKTSKLTQLKRIERELCFTLDLLEALVPNIPGDLFDSDCNTDSKFFFQNASIASCSKSKIGISANFESKNNQTEIHSKMINKAEMDTEVNGASICSVTSRNSSSEVRKAQDIHDWSCPMCTYSNTAKTAWCEICGQASPLILELAENARSKNRRFIQSIMTSEFPENSSRRTIRSLWYSSRSFRSEGFQILAVRILQATSVSCLTYSRVRGLRIFASMVFYLGPDSLLKDRFNEYMDDKNGINSYDAIVSGLMSVENDLVFAALQVIWVDMACSSDSFQILVRQGVGHELNRIAKSDEVSAQCKCLAKVCLNRYHELGRKISEIQVSAGSITTVEDNDHLRRLCELCNKLIHLSSKKLETSRFESGDDESSVVDGEPDLFFDFDTAKSEPPPCSDGDDHASHVFEPARSLTFSPLRFNEPRKRRSVSHPLDLPCFSTPIVQQKSTEVIDLNSVFEATRKGVVNGKKNLYFRNSKKRRMFESTPQIGSSGLILEFGEEKVKPAVFKNVNSKRRNGKFSNWINTRNSSSSRRSDWEKPLKDLKEILCDDASVTLHELCESGLVRALHSTLSNANGLETAKEIVFSTPASSMLIERLLKLLHAREQCAITSFGCVTNLTKPAFFKVKPVDRLVLRASKLVDRYAQRLMGAFFGDELYSNCHLTTSEVTIGSLTQYLWLDPLVLVYDIRSVIWNSFKKNILRAIECVEAQVMRVVENAFTELLSGTQVKRTNSSNCNPSSFGYSGVCHEERNNREGSNAPEVEDGQVGIVIEPFHWRNGRIVPENEHKPNAAIVLWPDSKTVNICRYGAENTFDVRLLHTPSAYSLCSISWRKNVCRGSQLSYLDVMPLQWVNIIVKRVIFLTGQHRLLLVAHRNNHNANVSSQNYANQLPWWVLSESPRLLPLGSSLVANFDSQEAQSFIEEDLSLISKIFPSEGFGWNSLVAGSILEVKLNYENEWFAAVVVACSADGPGFFENKNDVSLSQYFLIHDLSKQDSSSDRWISTMEGSRIAPLFSQCTALLKGTHKKENVSKHISSLLRKGKRRQNSSNQPMNDSISSIRDTENCFARVSEKILWIIQRCGEVIDIKTKLTDGIVTNGREVGDTVYLAVKFLDCGYFFLRAKVVAVKENCYAQPSNVEVVLHDDISGNPENNDCKSSDAEIWVSFYYSNNLRLGLNSSQVMSSLPDKSILLTPKLIEDICAEGQATRNAIIKFLNESLVLAWNQVTTVKRLIAELVGALSPVNVLTEKEGLMMAASEESSAEMPKFGVPKICLRGSQTDNEGANIENSKLTDSFSLSLFDSQFESSSMPSVPLASILSQDGSSLLQLLRQLEPDDSGEMRSGQSEDRSKHLEAIIGVRDESRQSERTPSRLCSNFPDSFVPSMRSDQHSVSSRLVQERNVRTARVRGSHFDSMLIGEQDDIDDSGVFHFHKKDGTGEPTVQLLCSLSENLVDQHNLSSDCVLLNSLMRMDAYVESQHCQGSSSSNWCENIVLNYDVDIICETNEDWERRVFDAISPNGVVELNGTVRRNVNDCSMTADSPFPSVSVLTAWSRLGQRYYYEVEIINSGLAQIGWASTRFMPKCRDMGCGDDCESWAFDGSRRKRFYINSSDWGAEWKAGDVIGCALELNPNKSSRANIYLSINGCWESPMGVAFQDVVFSGISLRPMVSFTGSFRFKLQANNFKFEPPFEGFKPIAETVFLCDNAEKDNYNGVRTKTGRKAAAKFFVMDQKKMSEKPLVSSCNRRSYFSNEVSEILSLLSDISTLSSVYEAANRPDNISTTTQNSRSSTIGCEMKLSSQRLTQKFVMQIQDALSVCTNTLPLWLWELARQFKFLIPIEARMLLFETTSFCISRAVHRIRENGIENDGNRLDSSRIPTQAVSSFSSQERQSGSLRQLSSRNNVILRTDDLGDIDSDDTDDNGNDGDESYKELIGEDHEVETKMIIDSTDKDTSIVSAKVHHCESANLDAHEVRGTADMQFFRSLDSSEYTGDIILALRDFFDSTSNGYFNRSSSDFTPTRNACETKCVRIIPNIEGSRPGRLGHLRQHKAVVLRSHVLDAAMHLMSNFTLSNSVLSVQFSGETGHGLGPTQEFYSLVCMELQRADLCIWYEERKQNSSRSIDNTYSGGENNRYVFSPLGLWPGPLPATSVVVSQDVSCIDSNAREVLTNDTNRAKDETTEDVPGIESENSLRKPTSGITKDTNCTIGITHSRERALTLFEFIGRFIGKALQDRRLLDLPLSIPLCKLLLDMELQIEDVCKIDKAFGESLKFLNSLKLKIELARESEDFECKALPFGQPISSNNRGKTGIICDLKDTIESLFLVFTMPGNDSEELIPNGRNIDVNTENLGEYLRLVQNRMLVVDVSDQVMAIRKGISEAFSLKAFRVFTPHELQSLFSGDNINNDRHWQKDEILKHIVCNHGFEHESPQIQDLAQFMSELGTTDRRLFTQFLTGSPRLPIGGFGELRPRLTVVRKSLDNPDDHLPSCSTCQVYLKLPPYSSLCILKRRVLQAIREGQGYFAFD